MLSQVIEGNVCCLMQLVPLRGHSWLFWSHVYVFIHCLIMNTLLGFNVELFMFLLRLGKKTNTNAGIVVKKTNSSRTLV